MPVEGYKGITLPKEMVDEIKRVIAENPELGYSSVAEFVKDAIREKITEIRKLYSKPQESIKPSTNSEPKVEEVKLTPEQEKIVEELLSGKREWHEVKYIGREKW